MSIYIEQRQYTNRKGETGVSIKIYDDYDTKSIDIDGDSLFDSDIELLVYVIEIYYDHFRDFLDHIKEHECGVNVDGTFYDFDEIAEFFD